MENPLQKYVDKKLLTQQDANSIYRRGKITLSQLMKLAGKVQRKPAYLGDSRILCDQCHFLYYPELEHKCQLSPLDLLLG